MLLDVRPDHLEFVRGILQRLVPDREVWAFGSRAKWTARDTSDLDLCIVGDTPLGFKRLGQLRDAFSESSLPYKVDVADWATTNESFRKIIERDKVVVQRATKQPVEGVAGEWREMPFSQAVMVNPRVQLTRGSTYPFVDMGAVNASARYACASEQRPFDGGGSRFAAGDTLMARITPCLENGKIARFCGGQGAVAHGSTEFIVIRGREGITDTAYAYYLTKWDGVSGYAISQMTGTSGRQRVPSEALDHLDIPVPPLAEQRAIAHILGTLDNKIELNRRMSETLEAMARALFESWFVDFGPVRATLEGRDPSLPKPLADLFPARLVDSELGEIPEGWEVKPLPEVIEVNPTRSLRKGEVAPYLDMANMPTRGHTPDNVVDRPFGSGMRFVNGDTLVARITPCLENGKTAFVDFLGDGQVGWGSTEYIVLRPKRPLPPQLAYCLARSAVFRDFAIQSMTGSSGRQRVPAESLDHFLLAASPELIARAFGRAVAPLFARAKEAATESRTLAALRDTLLPKLISGELRVTYLGASN